VVKVFTLRGRLDRLRVEAKMRSKTTGIFVALAVGAALLASAPVNASIGGEVAINELMPSPVTDDAEFLELRNVSGAPIDVGGWCVTEGISVCLPAATMIAADGFLLLVQDEAIARAEWGIDISVPLYVYSGGQKGKGETIRLEDDLGGVADEVTYSPDSPWDGGYDDGTGTISLERLNPNNASGNPLNWASSNPAPTPGSENSVYDVSAGPPLQVTNLAAMPFRPLDTDAIVITAAISAVASAELTYVVNFELPVTIPMTTGDGITHTATIPAQGPGDLVRFRVDADDGTNLASAPALGESITYEGVVVLDPTVETDVPVIEWFMEDAVYDDLLANHRYDDVAGAAVMTYDGVVYDNVEMRVRGNSTRSAAKVSWKVEFPSGQLFEMPGLTSGPVDEFNLQRDAWPIAVQSWQAVIAGGQPEIDTVFVRQQRNGEFHGLGAYLNPMDGRWRDENGYADGAYYKVSDSRLQSYSSEAVMRASGDFEKKEGPDDDFTDLWELTNGIDDLPIGDAQLDFFYDNFDIPALVNYLALVSLIRHVDSANQNYRITRDGDTGRWELLHWDLDYTWRPSSAYSDPADLRSEFPMAQYLNNRLYQRFFEYPEFEELFYRRMRTLRDEVIGDTALTDQYTATVQALLPEYALEDAKWGISGTTNGKMSANILRVQFQRDEIDDSSDVPASQLANPIVVINEIHYDPAEGSDGEYVELYNPGAAAIDMSDWSLADAVDITFRGGTVIPAGGHMVFVRDDAVFRSINASGIYVGGDYSGKLSNGGERVALIDSSGAVVDELTYGDAAPWPIVAAGASLERIDHTGPSDDGSNWKLSATGGSPGEANSPLPVITPAVGGGFEGDEGTVFFQIPVTLSDVSDHTVTVDWTTFPHLDGSGGLAISDVDFVSAAGQVSFAPGETEKFVEVEVLGDIDVEAPLLYGEWAFVVFDNASNAAVSQGFYGLGLLIILDDD
jgi:spore coat protein CotH